MTQIKPFTGRHITAILVAFFAVVLAVNIFMATLAVRGFGGTVVDNSYVASQQFNGWLADARTQGRLGWQQHLAMDGARRLTVVVGNRDGSRVKLNAIDAHAEHPLGQVDDIMLHFVPEADGQYRAREVLPPGRWKVHASVSADGHEMRFVEDVR